MITTGLARVHAAGSGLAAVEAAVFGNFTPENSRVAAPRMSADTTRADNFKIGVTQERARLRAILMSPEAAHRSEVAQHIAFETDMSAEQAIKVLGTMPAVQQEARRGGSPLDDAYAAHRRQKEQQPAAHPITDLHNATTKLLAKRGLKPIER